ncbi:MAG: GcrA family cell cycle regulator [Alphaproteobacteria bacterium]|nr:GcrA family cell cycle regulator [Alphaproteobacteria bacterium]
MKALWREGRTAEAISLDLGSGISRNAVLGKVHRLGLSAGGHGATPVIKTLVSKRPTRSAPKPTVKSLCLAPVEHPEFDVPAEGLTTILSVRRLECRWPYGEPKDHDFKLCGRRVERGSFCGAHAGIGYRQSPGGRQALMALAGLA